MDIEGYTGYWNVKELKPYQLLWETRNPLPMRSGDIRKIDSEYIRDGTCSIFVLYKCFIAGTRQKENRPNGRCC